MSITAKVETPRSVVGSVSQGNQPQVTRVTVPGPKGDTGLAGSAQNQLSLASDVDTTHALDLISNKQIDVSQLITHKYNLQECQQAFVHAKSGDNAMKIIISN